MLESMIDNPRPTRAEASDVSNALFDGSDAVMLSGETAVGKYPEQTVNMMRKIAQTTEASKLYKNSIEHIIEDPTNTEAIVHSAAQVAKIINAKCIQVYTFSGKTALLLSKYRPPCPGFRFYFAEIRCPENFRILGNLSGIHRICGSYRRTDTKRRRSAETEKTCQTRVIRSLPLPV